MNRRLVVSILAMLLVLTMILSLVLTVIPVKADAAELSSVWDPSAAQGLAENCN